MRTLALLSLVSVASIVVAAPPVQTSVETVLGPKAFRDGDVVEITDVKATSSKLEQGDSVTVKGRARLQSLTAADLSLYLTQTEGNGTEETDRSQTVAVKKGMQDFELKITVKHRGVLHLTFYNHGDGKPFGGCYFGTAGQMKSIADLDLSYYLQK